METLTPAPLKARRAGQPPEASIWAATTRSADARARRASRGSDASSPATPGRYGTEWTQALNAVASSIRRALARGCHTPRTLTTGGFASYLGVVDDPIIAPSALKHRLGEEEILHAYRNPIRVWDLGTDSSC
jgi:hypothetical protein